MIPLEQHAFHAGDNTKIYYYTTPVIAQTRGIVLIIHGMMEHGRRFNAFADALFRQGYASYIIDQRGHGQTGREKGPLGHFSDSDGWKAVISDIRELCFIAKNAHPHLPLFIIGHSMGSVVARDCVIQFSTLLDGAVFMGTTMGKNAFMLKCGQLLAKKELKKHGPQYVSPLLNKLIFSGYNNGFKTKRTALDWLSENTENIDDYIADPLAGFKCTTAFYADFFEGIDHANRLSNLRHIPCHFPMLLLSGSRDPVSGMGVEVCRLYERMQKAGLDRVDMKLYEGMRHEIHNEQENARVYRDILYFFNSVCA